MAKRIWTKEQLERKKFMDKKRYLENKEKVSQEEKEKYASDPEYRVKKVEASRQRYAAKREQIRAKAREKYRTDEEFRQKDILNSKIWRENNREKCIEKNKRWVELNRARSNEIKKKYVQRNPEKQAEARKKWIEENPDRIKAYARVRKFYIRRATIYKDEKTRILQIYLECAEISKQTGVQHHVDHIIPLRGRKVCGLHCLDNLRIIPAKDNQAKGNKWEIDFNVVNLE
jgi:hypothetical protein